MLLLLWWRFIKREGKRPGVRPFVMLMLFRCWWCFAVHSFFLTLLSIPSDPHTIPKDMDDSMIARPRSARTYYIYIYIFRFLFSPGLRGDLFFLRHTSLLRATSNICRCLYTRRPSVRVSFNGRIDRHHPRDAPCLPLILCRHFDKREACE